MHVAPYQNENRPLFGAQNEAVPLTYFNIVKLKRGETFEYRVPGYETCIAPATGTVDVSTSAAASAALASLDTDIDTVSTSRATFGAIQNRFEAVISNLQNYAENLTASRSRIQDADFAAETANLTRGQILQQAGISVLAQANAAPQSALALLN